MHDNQAQQSQIEGQMDNQMTEPRSGIQIYRDLQIKLNHFKELF